MVRYLHPVSLMPLPDPAAGGVLPDDCTQHAFPIEGLELQPNPFIALDSRDGWFSTKVPSSPGPLISDFVTHEIDFSYTTYGIHIGQDDRLTFFGPQDARPIHGHFVDCRSDSPTRGASVSVAFAPSAHRRLVIPRGVAHTFDNLAGIVTRDEPVWFVDENNPDYNLDNDLVSFGRTAPPESRPLVRPNRHLLPRAAHHLLSRLSQKLLENPRAYLNRLRVEIGGEVRYVALDSTTWVDREAEVARHLAPRSRIDGVRFAKNRYALTGKQSYTLVPSTDACVADVLVLEPQQRSETMFVHARALAILTFMNAEGTPIEVRLFDSRKTSPSEGTFETLTFPADPRVHLVIPNGVAYAISAPAELIVRREIKVFVDRREPRTDIPMFGRDLYRRSRSELDAGWRVDVPTLECPASVVVQLARAEQL